MLNSALSDNIKSLKHQVENFRCLRTPQAKRKACKKA